jgi:hypothetical protein
MQSVDTVLSPRATPAANEEAAALRQRLQSLLQRLAAPQQGLVSRADRLLMLQASRPSRQGHSEEEDATLTRLLPELTSHLEGQQEDLMRLVDSVKGDARDLSTLAKNLHRGPGSSGNSRGPGSAYGMGRSMQHGDRLGHLNSGMD